jgi:predicted exporter
LQPFGEKWLGLVPLIGVGDASSDSPLRNFAAAHGLSYLDLRDASAKLLESFLRETHKKLVLATAIIAVVLAIGIRNMRRFRMVLLPILLALALDFSLLLILQGWANLFHLVSLLLVLGLEIDYSLFFSRASGSADSRARTGFALSVCAVSSFAMFGMLSLSSIPVLHAVGSTVAIGIALAFPLAFMLARNR